MSEVTTCRTCRLQTNGGPVHMRCSCNKPTLTVSEAEIRGEGARLRLPHWVEITRREPGERGEHVSSFTGAATLISIAGPVMTVEASDGNGVFFTVVLTHRGEEA